MNKKLTAAALVACSAILLNCQAAEASVIGKIKFFVKAPFIVVHQYAANIWDGIYSANYYVKMELADAWYESR